MKEFKIRKISEILMRRSYCRNVEEPMENRVKGGLTEANKETQREEAKREMKEEKEKEEKGGMRMPLKRVHSKNIHNKMLVEPILRKGS